jgi:DNA-binding PadR family transcriptional regulator
MEGVSEKVERMKAEILSVIINPLRSKILIEVGKRKSLTWNEIKNKCHLRVDGKVENEGWIFYNVQLLERKGFIVKESIKKIKTTKGERKRTLYRITQKGELTVTLIQYLTKAIKKYLRNMPEACSFLYKNCKCLTFFPLFNV